MQVFVFPCFQSFEDVVIRGFTNYDSYMEKEENIRKLCSFHVIKAMLKTSPVGALYPINKKSKFF